MTGSVNDTIAWFLGAFVGSILAYLILIRDVKYIAEQYKLHRDKLVNDEAKVLYQKMLQEERTETKIEREVQRRLKQRKGS